MGLPLSNLRFFGSYFYLGIAFLFGCSTSNPAPVVEESYCLTVNFDYSDRVIELDVSPQKPFRTRVIWGHGSYCELGGELGAPQSGGRFPIRLELTEWRSPESNHQLQTQLTLVQDQVSGFGTNASHYQVLLTRHRMDNAFNKP